MILAVMNSQQQSWMVNAMVPRVGLRRRGWRAAGFLAAAGAVLVLGACSLFAPKFERPNLSVAAIQMLDGNFFQQNFLVRLKIQNPNNRELPVDGLSADLKIAGEPFASGVSNRAFVVPAFGETEFEMTVSANMAVGLLKLLAKNQDQRESIDYELNGKVSIDLPFMRSIPFHQNGAYSLKGKSFSGS
jgi:LEA14-like dessication related protein